MPLSPSHPIPCSPAEEEICPFLLWKSAAVIKPFSLFYSYSEIPWDEPLSPLHWDFPALGSAFKMLISPYPLLKITQDIDHGILPIAQTRKAWPTAAVAGTREAFVGRGGRSGAAFCLQAFESSWNRHSHLLSVTCMEKASRDIYGTVCNSLCTGLRYCFCNGCTPRMFDEWGKLEPNLFLMHVTAACLSHQ